MNADLFVRSGAVQESVPAEIPRSRGLATSPSGIILLDLADHARQAGSAQVAFASLAQGDVLLGLLPLADNQHVRDLLSFGLADLVVDLLIAQVGARADALGQKARQDFPRIRILFFSHSQDPGLDRAQPHRESPGIVFDQQGEEALDCAQDRPVHQICPVMLAVRAHVIDVEALGLIEVELARRDTGTGGPGCRTA